MGVSSKFKLLIPKDVLKDAHQRAMLAGMAKKEAIRDLISDGILLPFASR
jgi:hypothetical protein